jgi:hypothetical protein
MKPAILGVLIALPLTVSADVDEVGKNAPPLPPSPPPTAISGDIGVAVTNQYNSRGLILENKGVVWQPYGDLYLKLHDGDGFIKSFSLQAGIWNDINPAGPIAAHDANNKAWTEFFWQTGFIVDFAQRFSLSSVYRQYTSPSDAYRFGRPLNNVLSFDDSGLLDKNFSFQPHVTVLYELPGPGHNGFRGHSWYFAPGITPNYTFFTGSKMPVTCSLPLTVGLGSSFYAGSTFGYFAVGPRISVPLRFIPEKCGAWTLSIGYRYYRLGNTTTQFAGQHSNQNNINMSAEMRF